MNYVKSSKPEPSEGVSFENEVDQVVPDQSLSLEEILTRFTRGEAMPVGMETQEGIEDDNPLNVDLEKLANSDLVDKEEFIGKLRDLQNEYTKQEKQKAAEVAAKKAEEYKKLDAKRIRIAAKKLAAKGKSEKLA